MITSPSVKKLWGPTSALSSPPWVFIGFNITISIHFVDTCVPTERVWDITCYSTIWGKSGFTPYQTTSSYFTSDGDHLQ